MPEILTIVLILAGVLIGAFAFIKVFSFFKTHYTTKKTSSSLQSTHQKKSMDNGIAGLEINNDHIAIDANHNPLKSFEKTGLIDGNKISLPQKNLPLKRPRPHMLLHNYDVSTERDAVLTPSKADPEITGSQPQQQEDSQQKKHFFVLFSNMPGDTMTPEKKLNPGQLGHGQDDLEDHEHPIIEDDGETNWFKSLRVKGQEEDLLIKQIKACKDKKKDEASSPFVRV